MPAGTISNRSRSRYFTNSRAARASSVTRARQSVTWLPKQSTTNRPVRRALRKPRAPRTKVQRNKNAIYTLSRQVKQLQNQRLGEYQKNIQWCHLEGGTLPQSGSPVAFLVNDLYNNSHVMKGVLTNGVPGFAENSTWSNVINDTDIGAAYQTLTRENDVLSPVVYKPIFSRINLTFRVGWHGTWPLAGYIRVTILKMKSYNQTSKLMTQLPGNLGAMRYLANESSNRNYFNPDYHRVLLDKWIKFTPEKSTTTAGTDCNLIQRTISIPWKFGQRETLRPDFQGDPAERFWTNVPEPQQTWCLISCGANLDAHLQKLSLGRCNSWRDQHGTT